MDTRAGKSSAVVGLPDVLMATLSNDTFTETSRPGTTLKNSKFQLWERELLESSEVRRKSTVAQLCKCYRARTSIYSDSTVQISLTTISNF